MKFLRRERKPILGMRSTLTFGKYKGKSIKEVVDSDPGYIKWCREEGIFNLNSYTSRVLNSQEGLFCEEEYDYWDPMWD